MYSQNEIDVNKVRIPIPFKAIFCLNSQSQANMLKVESFQPC